MSNLQMLLGVFLAIQLISMQTQAISFLPGISVIKQKLRLLGQLMLCVFKIFVLRMLSYFLIIFKKFLFISY